MSVIQGDALRLPFPDSSVDLIVTSPPYFALRSYQDGGEHYGGQVGSEGTPTAFLEVLWACTAEWQRVLKPTGSLWVNLGDKYAGSGGHNNAGLAGKAVAPPPGVVVAANGHGSRRRNAPDSYNKASDGIRAKSLMGLPWRYAIGCIDGRAGDPMVLRAEVVWSKPNGLPESVRDRVRRSHEQFFHLTREGDYYSAVDEIREPHLEVSLRRAAPHRSPSGVAHQGSDMSQSPVQVEQMCNPLGKLPGSVWTIPTDPLIVSDAVRAHYNLPDHFAAFPQEWPRRIILGWSPAGICVECGEGRRPVVTRVFRGEYNDGEGERQQLRSAQSGGTAKVTLGRTDEVDRAITACACACALPAAPTRPAVVLDPFSGTGTVAGVARALGRTAIGVDLSYDYCRLAQWFLRDGRRFAKSASRTDAERQGAFL